MVVGIDGYLKIIDFGFAKIIKEKGKKAMTICGTWCYFAPELIKLIDRDAPERIGYGRGVDMWAFGCLLHEL